MKCSWFTCEKEAVWNHPRSNNVFCDEHAQINQVRFFGLLTYERIAPNKACTRRAKVGAQKVSSKSKKVAKPARG
jgi:hypothetical protein